MHKLNIYEKLSLALIIASILIVIIVYPSIPQKMTTHWNEIGEPNGYMHKLYGLGIMPLISLVCFISLYFFVREDKTRETIYSFEKYFYRFILILFIFFFYMFLLTIFWNIGYTFNLISFIVPAFCVIFYYCGILIEHSKRNWFIGIRTPYTLSDDVVWNKTHKVGGLVYKISAVIAIIGMLFPKYAFYFVLYPIITGSLFVVVYSYVVYKNYMKNKHIREHS
ncbi:MAG: SdpI family protein [archaeon]